MVLGLQLNKQETLKTLIIRTGPYAYFSRYSYGMTSHHDLYNIYHVTFIYSLSGASDCLLSSVGRALGLE